MWDRADFGVHEAARERNQPASWLVSSRSVILIRAKSERAATPRPGTPGYDAERSMTSWQHSSHDRRQHQHFDSSIRSACSPSTLQSRSAPVPKASSDDFWSSSGGGPIVQSGLRKRIVERHACHLKMPCNFPPGHVGIKQHRLGFAHRIRRQLERSAAFADARPGGHQASSGTLPRSSDRSNSANAAKT